MPRYIDADALMKVIREHDYPLRSHFNSTDNGMFTIGVQQAVDEAPTIEAVPVVRGEWIVDECDSTDDVPSYSWICFHCSECNADYDLEEGQYGWCRYEKIPYNYCPNCGCDMRGESNSDDIFGSPFRR